MITYEKLSGTKVAEKTRISSREDLYCYFRAKIAKIGIQLILNRSAHFVFLTKRFFKKVLILKKRFVSWMFCILDVL
jgi:hypothetical protein